jgi:hypothetical protein
VITEYCRLESDYEQQTAVLFRIYKHGKVFGPILPNSSFPAIKRSLNHSCYILETDRKELTDKRPEEDNVTYFMTY